MGPCCWALAALPLLLVACDGDPDRRERAGEPPDAVVVTRQDASLPSGCRPGEVAALIQEFFEDFNRGDPAAAEAFAPELAPEPGWYSVGEGAAGTRRRNFVARDRRTLRTYIAARHRRHERLRLTEVIVDHSRALGQIEFELDRRADDLRGLGIRTRTAGGKGAIDCGRRKIVVWSMGMPHDDLHLCPPAANRSRSPVACSRGS